jgi:hypothetical protein
MIEMTFTCHASHNDENFSYIFVMNDNPKRFKDNITCIT